MKPKRKKLLLGTGIATIAVVVVACACVAVYLSHHLPKTIDENLFPDEALRSYVLEKVDLDGDGRLSEDEASRLNVMILSDVEHVSGLDVFPNLQTVLAGGESLTSVDIDGASGLTRLDLSGAKNLTSLNLQNTLNLKNVDIRGTGLTSVDFSRAGHLTQVLADPKTKLSGLETSTVERSLVTRFVGQNRGSVPYDVGYFQVSASYDDDTGRLLERDITGDIQANITYTYDDAGWLQHVSVQNAQNGVGGEWSLTYQDGAILASTPDGQYVNRTYDGKGHLTSLSIKEQGAEEAIEASITFSYDGRGFLNGATVQSGDATTEYDITCNDSGQVETITGSDGSGKYMSYSGDAYSTIGDLSTTDSSKEVMSSADGHASLVSRSDDGTVSEVVGRFGANRSDGGSGDISLIWGRIASVDGSSLYQYDAFCDTYDILASDPTQPSAIDLSNNTRPTAYADYWLLGKAETALEIGLKEGSQHGWSMQSTDPIVIATFDTEAESYYQGHRVDIASCLGLEEASLRHAYVNLGGESPCLFVTDTNNPDSFRAVYQFDGNKLRLIKAVDESSSMRLCGSGYIKTICQDGSESIAVFSGVAFDEVARFDSNTYFNSFLGIETDASQAINSLEATYPDSTVWLPWSA